MAVYFPKLFLACKNDINEDRFCQILPIMNASHTEVLQTLGARLPMTLWILLQMTFTTTSLDSTCTLKRESIPLLSSSQVSLVISVAESCPPLSTDLVA